MPTVGQTYNADAADGTERTENLLYPNIPVGRRRSNGALPPYRPELYTDTTHTDSGSDIETHEYRKHSVGFLGHLRKSRQNKGPKHHTPEKPPHHERRRPSIQDMYHDLELMKPSLELFPTDHERKFSHVSIAHIETQTDQQQHVYVSRDIYTQEDIDVMYDGEKTVTTCCDKVKQCAKCTPTRCWGLLTFFLPIIEVLRTYRIRKYLLADIISGITVACMHFPQGLAYGILASLSPIQGLYSSSFPAFFYSFYGTSQHMSLGADAVIAIITAETVDTELQDDFLPSRLLNAATENVTITEEEMLAYKVSIASGSTMLCGIILMVMGFCRLGFLASYLSKSFIGGFTTAAAFHIFTSQIPKAFGIKIPVIKGICKLVYTYIAIIKGIGAINWWSLLVVAICAAFMLFVKDYINVRFRDKLKMPIPVDLLVMIIATIISRFANLDTAGIEVVGIIPSGIPLPGLPNMSRFPQIFSNSFQMAMLIFFLTIAMAKLCAEKHEYELDDNQELMSYGMMNLSCSFFPCFPATTSPPRSMLLSYMGARTTLNGIFTSVIMVLVLVVLGRWFTTLPVPALAAMIFVSVKPLLLQVRCLPKLYRVNKYDFVIWITSCSTGILLDLPYGLLCGIGISFVMVVLQNQKSNVGTLLQAKNDHLFLSEKKGRSGSSHAETRGVKIFRMNSSIYFATTDRFRRNLYNLTVNPLLIPHPSSSAYSNSSTEMNTIEDTNFNKITNSDDETEKEQLEQALNDEHDRVKVIIIDCSCVSYIDIQGINTLSVVFEEYRRVNITVFLAGCTTFVWDCLKKSEFFEVVSKERVFFELEDAYHAAKLLV